MATVRKTLIVYAAMSLHAAIMEKAVTPAREAGQSIRLVAIELFDGERETGAAAVVVIEGDKDVDGELMDRTVVIDKIRSAYPDIEVEISTADRFDVPKFAAKVDDTELPDYEDELKTLRGQLVALGGSVPAGATADELRQLVSAQEMANKAENDKEGAKQAAAADKTAAAKAGDKK